MGGRGLGDALAARRLGWHGCRCCLCTLRLGPGPPDLGPSCARPCAPAAVLAPRALPPRRQYCQDEPDWQAAVELLSQDDGAGWRLLADLASGGRGAAQLAASRFCEL